jgi:nucleoside-diphosphate-sugar epimerase
LRLFVTGGAGFLGRRVVVRARAAGHDVTALSRRAAPPGLPDGTALAVGDLNDSAALPGLIAEAAPDAVVHAAAIVSDTDPHLHHVNVTGTANLIHALQQPWALQRKGGPPRLVYVSSFAVEDIPPTPYSESKLEAEGLVRASGLPFVIVRPTLIYGAGDSGNTPRLVERMAAGRMWLPAGGTTRIQPVHVDDVAAALVVAATREGVAGNTYRLGGAKPISVRDWRHAVRDATGGEGRVSSIPLPLYLMGARVAALLGVRKPLAVAQFHLADHAVDSSAARNDLEFDPRPLAEGLAATFD